MTGTSTADSPRAVRISSPDTGLHALGPLLSAAHAASGDVPALLELAQTAAGTAPSPGDGRTAQLWEILASVTAVDVAAGRVLEPHLDAAAILAQANTANTASTASTATTAGAAPADRGPAEAEGLRPAGTWGVFAAEAAGLRLEARPTGNGFRLHGSKPWCSLAAQLDGAVVTAHTDAGARAAFAVDLRAPGVDVADPGWTSRGLREIPSGTVHFEDVPAVPLGGPGWYYRRPGFAWGGMGVAACWFGGAVAVARGFAGSLRDTAAGGRDPDQVALAHLGEIDRTLSALRACLAQAAARIDAGDLSGPGAWNEALRVRGTVASAVGHIQSLVSQNLGPGPLVFDEQYGKRMADLSLYLLQHRAMRDDAQLGGLTLAGGDPW